MVGGLFLACGDDECVCWWNLIDFRDVSVKKGIEVVARVLSTRPHLNSCTGLVREPPTCCLSIGTCIVPDPLLY